MRRLILIILFCFLITSSQIFSWELEQMTILFKRGESLYKQGKYKEVIKVFQRVLEISPDNKLVQDYIRRAEEKKHAEAELLKERMKQEANGIRMSQTSENKNKTGGYSTKKRIASAKRAGPFRFT